MGTSYASVSDITALGISLTPQQEASAEVLISQASAKLRTAAKDHGVDIDARISEDEDYGITVQSVIVQAVIRALNSLSDSDPAVSQMSQGGLGYTATVTYFNAGQSLYFLKSELKELKLKRQTYGAIELYNS